MQKRLSRKESTVIMGVELGEDFDIAPGRNFQKSAVSFTYPPLFIYYQ